MSVSKIIDYEFENQDLLIRACTHFSYDSVVNNRTLGTIGTPALKCYVATRIYNTNPEYITQGEIHVLKSINLDNENLARGLTCGLEQHLRHGDMNEVDTEILRFRQDMQDYPAHSNGRLDVPKFLAGLVEAIVGAVWVDSRMNMVKTGDVIRRILGDLNVDYENYKLKPSEQYNSVKARYDLREKIDDVDGVPRCMILMNGRVIAEARYDGTPKVLKNRAASVAIEYLRIHRGLHI